MPTPPSTARSSPRSPTSPDRRLGRLRSLAAGLSRVRRRLRPDRLARAIQLALGDRSGTPSSSGALPGARPASRSAASWSGSSRSAMFLLALWQLAAKPASATSDEDGKKRVAKRRRIRGQGDRLRRDRRQRREDRGRQQLLAASGRGDISTAKLMNLPAASCSSAAVGLAIIGFGIYQLYRAWTEGFADKLDAEGQERQVRHRVHRVSARSVYIARGIAFIDRRRAVLLRRDHPRREEVRRPRPGAVRDPRPAVRPVPARGGWSRPGLLRTLHVAPRARHLSRSDDAEARWKSIAACTSGSMGVACGDSGKDPARTIGQALREDIDVAGSMELGGFPTRPRRHQRPALLDRRPRGLRRSPRPRRTRGSRHPRRPLRRPTR